MRVLLDTHVFLWFILGDRRCTPRIRAIIEDDANDCMVSIASVWEIALKHTLGKLALHRPIDQFFQAFTDGGFDPIPITTLDILTLASLPMHHRDPFDRMLIAQARSADMHLLTADPHFRQYDVPLL